MKINIEKLKKSILSQLNEDEWLAIIAENNENEKWVLIQKRRKILGN